MSSKITTEKYNVVRLEKIKHYLESLAERDNPKFYEIYVDNMKVIDKTNDPHQFDEYKMYVDENTQMLKLLLYTGSESSPRNDKFIFSFENGLDKTTLGEVDVQNKISSAINAERERLKIEQLENKVSALGEELDEANEYIERLESGLEQIKNQKADESKQVKYGMVASIAIEQLIRRNPKILNNIPLLGSLSGLLETTTNPVAESVSDSEKEQPSFQFKQVNKFESEIVKLFTDNFTETDLEVVLKILHRLAEEPTSIITIHDLLFLKPSH